MKRHFKPLKKKQYTKTQKVIYHTSKFLGSAGREIKAGLKAGYKGATHPKVQHYFKETRAELAREMEPRRGMSERELQELENQLRAERVESELEKIRERKEAKMFRPELQKSNLKKPIKRFKEPFSRVVRESKDTSMKLGWGGF